MELTPTWHAAATPDAPAIIMGSTGETTTLRRARGPLEPVRPGAARRGASAPATTSPSSWRTTGRSSRSLWAAQRSGLHFTADQQPPARRPRCSTSSTTAARSRSCRRRRWPTSSPASTSSRIAVRVSAVGDLAGVRALRRGARRRGTRPARRRAGGPGDALLVGHHRAAEGRAQAAARARRSAILRRRRCRSPRASAMYGVGPGSVYLSPAPLYHAAPLVYSMSMHRLGADGRGDGAVRRRASASS